MRSRDELEHLSAWLDQARHTPLKCHAGILWPETLLMAFFLQGFSLLNIISL